MSVQIKTSVQINGGEEIYKALTERSERFAKKGLREALRAGAAILHEAISLNVRKGWHVWTGKGNRSRDFGFISTHIGVKIRLSEKQESGQATIGPVKKGFWATMLEFGTSKMAPKPFMRPAFDANKESALQAFVDKLREILKLEMSK